MFGGIHGSPEVLGGPEGEVEGAACGSPECQLFGNWLPLRRGAPNFRARGGHCVRSQGLDSAAASLARAEKWGSWGWAQVRPLSLRSDILQEGNRAGEEAGRLRDPSVWRRHSREKCCWVRWGAAASLLGKRVCVSLRICRGTEGCCALSDKYKRMSGALLSAAFLLSAQIFHNCFLGTYCVPGTALGRWAPAGYSMQKARGVCLL